MHPWTLSSEMKTGDLVPTYTGLILSFHHGFYPYRCQNVLKCTVYHQTLKVD